MKVSSTKKARKTSFGLLVDFYFLMITSFETEGQASSESCQK